MGSDKKDVARWADLVLDGKPINIDQTIRQQADRIVALEEAVRVLATMVYEWELACGLSDAWQRNGLILNRMANGTRMSNGFDDAVRGRMNNQIAAEAVRKAGG